MTISLRQALTFGLAAAILAGCGPTVERTLDFRFGTGGHVIVVDGRMPPTFLVEPSADGIRLTVYLGRRMTNEQAFAWRQYDVVFDREVLASTVEVSLVDRAFEASNA